MPSPARRASRAQPLARCGSSSVPLRTSGDACWRGRCEAPSCGGRPLKFILLRRFRLSGSKSRCFCNTAHSTLAFVCTLLLVATVTLLGSRRELYHGYASSEYARFLADRFNSGCRLSKAYAQLYGRVPILNLMTHADECCLRSYHLAFTNSR